MMVRKTIVTDDNGRGYIELPPMSGYVSVVGFSSHEFGSSAAIVVRAKHSRVVLWTESASDLSVPRRPLLACNAINGDTIDGVYTPPLLSEDVLCVEVTNANADKSGELFVQVIDRPVFVGLPDAVA